jgi:ABC-type Fe3+/spermidine/putrescine transport system ATPase subunit
MSVAVELRGVTFGYRHDGPVVLTDVHLNVAAGQVTTVLGASGSGKSTLLALVAGIERPRSGDVVFDTRTVTHLPTGERDIALVLQQPYLFPNLSVGENVTFGLGARGVARATRRIEAARWLARVGLDDMADRRPRALSGGEQQRVALVRALATRPSVLLLDEPLASLDPSIRSELQTLLRTIVAETGVTTIMVTHDLSEAMAMGTRTALLAGGRVVAEGPSQQVFERPPSRTAAMLMGITTFIDGTVRDGHLSTAAGTFAVTDTDPAGPATYAIRPEHIRLSATGAANTLSGSVTDCTYRGEYWEVRLDTPAGAVRTRSSQTLAMGTRTVLELPADYLIRLDTPYSAGG